jgi:hypothetical protein
MCSPSGVSLCNLLICNVDTDNIFGQSFVRQLAIHVCTEAAVAKKVGAASKTIAWDVLVTGVESSSASSSSASSSRAPKRPKTMGGRAPGTDAAPLVGRPLLGRGARPGMPGRVAIFAIDFIRSGGHDEDCLGAGYQDRDMVARVEAMLDTQMHLMPKV